MQVYQDTFHGFVDLYQTVPAMDLYVNPHINSTTPFFQALLAAVTERSRW